MGEVPRVEGVGEITTPITITTTRLRSRRPRTFSNPTALVQVLARGGIPHWLVHGTFTLPADYSKLAAVIIRQWSNGNATVLTTMNAPFSPNIFNMVYWTSPEYIQDTAEHINVAEFDCADSNGLVANNPATVGFTVLPAAPLTPPVSIGNVSVSEPGPRYLAPDTSTHTSIDVTITFSAAVGTQNITIWWSQNNAGTLWQWINWYPVPSGGE